MRIELFCASGGMAEGFRRAGITFDFAFDANPNACDSYEANLGHRPICMDVADLLRLVPRFVTDRPVQLFVADPPCTPWSRAGKREGLADERDMLIETVELIQLMSPATFLVANVPGLDDSGNWPIVQKVIGGLAEIGWCIDYARLDAADYGVPQHRVRPFWFGHRTETPCIGWPEKTHGEPEFLQQALPTVRKLKPWVTCRDALGHLPPEELGRPAKFAHNRRHVPNEPDAPSTTISAGGSRHQQNSIQWPWDRPSTSVMADPRIPPPGHHDRSFMGGAIALSERAGAVLQGFPETWHFAGKTKKDRWSQIGQAMPPPLAEAVARQIAARAA